MKQVFVHASMITLLAVVGSLGICWAILAVLGKPMSGLAVYMSILCPAILAFPVSAYNHHHKQKVTAAHEALTAAHVKLAAMHERLAEQARRDDMTGLLNRRAFIAAVEELRARGQQGALLLVDADDFKRINDTFGHLAGDEALRMIARTLRGVVRRADVKGRLGGEEFGVFITDVDLEEAFGVAERMRRAVANLEFRPGGRQPAVPLTVSIGVAAAREGAGFSELLGEADRQLYLAKGRGRNVVSMSTQAPEAA